MYFSDSTTSRSQSSKALFWEGGGFLEPQSHRCQHCRRKKSPIEEIVKAVFRIILSLRANFGHDAMVCFKLVKQLMKYSGVATINIPGIKSGKVRKHLREIRIKISVKMKNVPSSSFCLFPLVMECEWSRHKIASIEWLLAGVVFYLKQGWYLCTICKGAAECVMGNSKKSGCAARTAEPQFCGILANLRWREPFQPYFDAGRGSICPTLVFISN